MGHLHDLVLVEVHVVHGRRMLLNFGDQVGSVIALDFDPTGAFDDEFGCGHGVLQMNDRTPGSVRGQPCHNLAATFTGMVEVTLTGRVSVSHGDRILSENSLAGRLGRLLFVRLALSRHPMSRSDLIDDVWHGDRPSAVESVLNATCSRLRSALSSIGLDGKSVLLSSSGTLDLRLPPGSRIDVVSARGAIDIAEAALRKGDGMRAWSSAVVAHAISRRPLLPGFDGLWIERERDRLQHIHERSLTVLSDVWLERGDAVQARLMASELVRIAPYSEVSHRRLVAALVSGGDRMAAAAAVREWERLTSEDLGLAVDTTLRQLLASS